MAWMANTIPDVGISEKFSSWDTKKNADFIRKAMETGLISPNDPAAMDLLKKYLGLGEEDLPQTKNEDAQKLREELKKLL